MTTKSRMVAVFAGAAAIATLTVGGAITASAATSTPPATSYTLADVAKHSTATDCWTVLSGNVYDVTSFINSHPGGSGAIKSMCGVDGTAMFVGQHGNSASKLASLKKVGALAGSTGTTTPTPSPTPSTPSTGHHDDDGDHDGDHDGDRGHGRDHGRGEHGGGHERGERGHR